MDEDYDALRQKNISERNAIFSEFFKKLKKQTTEIKELEEKRLNKNNSENEPPKKRRRTTSRNSDSSVKIGKVHLEFRRKYNTRNSKKISSTESNDGSNDSEIEEENEDSPKRNRPKLQVLFPWAKPFQRTIDLMKMGVCDVDEEEEEEEEYNDFFAENTRKKRNPNRTKSEYDPDNIPSVDEITKNMLDNVAERSSRKTYCKIRGTSCHQCRQKTLDTKTVCRSGECVGVRGQFCGPCLYGRYGENAVDALKDPNWACPPCRGLCNCSICRTRNGLRPTGILAPHAQEVGYSSVMDYLQAAEMNDL